MRSLFLPVVVTLSSSSAWASTSAGHIERLVGWSADGTTWAVILEEGEVLERSSLVVHDGTGKRVDVYCGDEQCPASQRPRTKPTATHSALERIDVKTDPKLAAFQLSAVDASWRQAFANAFEITSTTVIVQHHEGCASKLAIRARTTNKVFTISSQGCGILGGYLHPDGMHALIKFSERFWDFDGARGALVSSVRYVLVKVD